MKNKKIYRKNTKKSDKKLYQKNAKNSANSSAKNVHTKNIKKSFYSVVEQSQNEYLSKELKKYANISVSYD